MYALCLRYGVVDRVGLSDELFIWTEPVTKRFYVAVDFEVCGAC